MRPATDNHQESVSRPLLFTISFSPLSLFFHFFKTQMDVSRLLHVLGTPKMGLIPKQKVDDGKLHTALRRA